MLSKSIVKVNEDKLQEAIDYVTDHGSHRTYPLEIVEILLAIYPTNNTIIAGLLSATISALDLATAGLQLQEVADRFGLEIANIVEGVVKLSTINYLPYNTTQAQKFFDLLFSMPEEIAIGVLFIKLSHLLHNISIFNLNPSLEQYVISALEIMEIYVPLMARIALEEIKIELQEACLQILQPESRQYILSHLYAVGGRNIKALINKIINTLHNDLTAARIKAKILGRIKSPYSIWLKTLQKDTSIEQLYDILAFRIIVDTVEQCYRSLDIIHNQYQIISGQFHDYIRNPKPNGYQSLHTIVIGPLRKNIEIQIRTPAMNEAAQHGRAAHWQYKRKPTVIKARIYNIYQSLHQIVYAPFIDILTISGRDSALKRRISRRYKFELPKELAVKRNINSRFLFNDNTTNAYQNNSNLVLRLLEANGDFEFYKTPVRLYEESKKLRTEFINQKSLYQLEVDKFRVYIYTNKDLQLQEQQKEISRSSGSNIIVISKLSCQLKSNIASFNRVSLKYSEKNINFLLSQEPQTQRRPNHHSRVKDIMAQNKNHKKFNYCAVDKVVEQQVIVALQKSHTFKRIYSLLPLNNNFIDETALIIAAQAGNIQVFKLLVAYLQDIFQHDPEKLREYINVQDNNNYTALHYAVGNYLSYDIDNIEIIRTLLSLQGHRGEHLVSEQEQIMVDTMILKALNEGEEMDAGYADEDSFYNVSPKLLVLKTIIDSLPTLEIDSINKININRAGNNGNTLLTNAIEQEDFPTIKFLLTYPEIDINKGIYTLGAGCVKNEWIPFLLAVKTGNVEIVQEFLAHPEIAISQSNQDYETALIIAAQAGNVQVFKLLVAHLQDIFKNDVEELREYINLQDSNNHTALYYAVGNYLSYDIDNVEIIQTLLQLQDNRGEHLVNEQEQIMVDTMILEALNEEDEADEGYKDEDSFYNVSQKLLVLKTIIDNLPTLKIDSINKININQAGKNGNTLLTNAIEQEDLATIKFLLTCPEININKGVYTLGAGCVKNEWVPFLLAVKTGNVEIVQEFLAHPEIDIIQVNQDHETALIIAAQAGNVQVFKLLATHLQDIFKKDVEELREYINLQDSNNHTALHYAVGNYLSYGIDNVEIIRTLFLLQDNRGEHLVSEQEQIMVDTMILEALNEGDEADEGYTDEDSFYNVSQKLLVLKTIIDSLPTLKIDSINKININLADEHDNIPLHIAVKNSIAHNQEAIKICDRIIEARPNNAESYYTKCIVLFGLSQQIVETATKSYNKSAESLRLGLTTIKEAIKNYSKAIELKLDYIETYQGPSVILWELAKFKNWIQEELNRYESVCEYCTINGAVELYD